ncbi:MAG: radical SAM protein [Archangiaceae bacterium]|nr:radical SAM protein [Archangiaceae bacterium]
MLRDYACGETTKADYYWAPIDLLVLSGLLRDHDVRVLDAAAEPLTRAQALERATAAAPEVVFTLTAAVTLAHDDAFLSELKAATGARIYALGDVAAFEPARTLARTESFDGLVQNFTDPTLRRLAAGETAQVTSVALRTAGGADVRPVVSGPLEYGLPQHALFPLHRYRMPFDRWERSTSVLTNHGCPFPCTFCPSRNLASGLRPLDAVVAELRHLEALGLTQFYLRDFTFGPTRARAHALCDAIVAARVRLTWSAECRLDVLEPELLEKMRRAGCDLILCGLETGDAGVSARLGKKLVLGRTRTLLEAARGAGVRVCGHFVLGSPDETSAELQRTLDFACAMPLDYASFNLYAPRLGTPMRDALAAAGRLAEDDFAEQDVSRAAQGFAQVSSRELSRFFRRAVLQFYFRPRQLARLVRVTPLSTLARQGVGVLRNLAEARA